MLPAEEHDGLITVKAGLRSRLRYNDPNLLPITGKEKTVMIESPLGGHRT